MAAAAEQVLSVIMAVAVAMTAAYSLSFSGSSAEDLAQTDATAADAAIITGSGF